MTPFNENFIAVGTANQTNNTMSGVVVVVNGVGKFTMSQDTARKLADDILRNANYLWPNEEERTNE